MTKMRWAAMGLMLLGGYVLQAFGCSSTPAATSSGGECCECTVKQAGVCSSSKTFKPLVAVADCTSFCAGQNLGLCSGSSTPAPTISAAGVACSDAGISPTGAGGGTGAGGSAVVGPDGAVISPGFGIQCTTDAQCGAGLYCLKSSDDIFPGASYPNGLCTADCAADPSICAQYNALCASDPDPNAVNPKSFCVEACNPGPVARGEVKCHNRADEACEPIDSSLTVFTCAAICTSDAECGARKCDIGSGLCVDMVGAGDPVGSPCMANAATDSCNGFCRPLPGQMPVQGGPAVPGRCSALCRFGGAEGCGWTRNPIAQAGHPVGGCLLPALDGTGIGDVGFCYQLCDSIADCSIKDKDWVCDKDPIIVMGSAQMGIPAFNHGACFFEPPEPDAAAPPVADAAGQ